VSVNGTLVEDKTRRFKGECAQCSFNKCPIYIRDGASAKFSTNSHETDNSVRYISHLRLNLFSDMPCGLCAVTETDQAVEKMLQSGLHEKYPNYQ
jgi:hypothetical protein